VWKLKTSHINVSLRRLTCTLGWFVYNSARWHLTHPQMIVLVGHGIGGLAIKYFLAQVDKHASSRSFISQNCKAFQENLQGIVFYALPRSESSEYYNLSVAYKEQLNFDFSSSIKEDTMIMAIVEGRPIGQEVQFHN
jgi:triacylglycerol esterase/lipase EstA (alpha/beta hydrolase family)